MTIENEYVFKLCLFGEGGVGKTTLIHRYINGLFIDSAMTIGVEVYKKALILNGTRIILQIWDCAGEERFRMFMLQYIHGADGGILMYDITRFSSIKNIDEWLAFIKIEEHKTNKSLPIIIVGGKSDLEEKRAFDKELADNIARQHGLKAHLECSAKLGDQVEKVFNTIAELMMARAAFLH